MACGLSGLGSSCPSWPHWRTGALRLDCRGGPGSAAGSLISEQLESASLPQGSLTPTRTQNLPLLQAWGGPLRSDPTGAGAVWLQAGGMHGKPPCTETPPPGSPCGRGLLAAKPTSSLVVLSCGTEGTEAGTVTFHSRAIASFLCTRWPQVWASPGAPDRPASISRSRPSGSRVLSVPCAHGGSGVGSPGLPVCTKRKEGCLWREHHPAPHVAAGAAASRVSEFGFRANIIPL